MKDLYELLNDLSIQDSKIDQVFVSEFEKKKLLSDVKKQIHFKKKRPKWPRSLLASVMTAGMILTSVIGLSFTSYAKDVPFLNSIYQFFNQDGHYNGYEEQATVLHLTQESNGIKMTLEKAVFDGMTLFLTYMLETEHDLGNEPFTDSLPSLGGIGLAGQVHMKKLEDDKYVALLQLSHYGKKPLNEANVTWDIERFSTEANQEGTLYEGNWNFSFTVPKTDSNVIEINTPIIKDDFTFTPNTLTISPMSATFKFNTTASENLTTKWDYMFPTLIVIDDLGNEYETILFHGTGQGVSYSNYEWSATFEQIHPDAKTLTITPIIELSENDIIGTDANGKPIKANYRSINSNGAEEKITLDPIIIQLD